MQALTVRFSEEQYDKLKIRSLIMHKAISEIIRESVNTCLEGTDDETLQELVAQARRVRGPKDPEASKRMATHAAHLDDQEGFGPRKIIRNKRAQAGVK